MDGRVLVQGQMCPKLVVIVAVSTEDPAQMGFAEDDDVIETFPADRADQSLRMSVLPGCLARRNGLLSFRFRQRR
jgi:hypothetical protein